MGKGIAGEGSIRKRISGKLAGKWRVQWAYEDPISEAQVTVDRTFPTQGEAAKFLKDLKAKVHTGQKIEEANRKKALTLNAWFDDLAGTKQNDFHGRWFEDGMKPQTIAVKVSRFDSHVRNSMLGELPITHIDTDRARAFFRMMKEQDKSKATIKDVQGVLIKVVNDAIDTYEKLPNQRNPFPKVKLESPEPREAIALSPKEAVAAVNRLTEPEDRAFLGLFLFAGLRMSEHLALCREQIDSKHGIIVVDRAVKVGRTGHQTIDLPKGDKIRIAVMCPTLQELLLPLAGTQRRHLFSAESEDKPRMKKLFYATWHRIVKEAELPSEIDPRDCRLSHNNWIEKLMPRVSLSTRLEHMGHSTSRHDSENKGITVNLRNYTRFLSESHAILRKELERVIRAAQPKASRTAAG